MHNFKELKIWQKSMLLVKELYPITNSFPDEEKYGVISQIRRSAVSIPSNIAEGTSRKSPKEFKYFLRISLGSLFELETQIILAKELNYLSEREFERIYPSLKELQKMVIGFENSLADKRI